MQQRFASVTALLAVSTVSILAAAAVFQKGGTESWTEPSGAASTNHAELLTTADYYGLQSVRLWEYGKHPCVLRAEQSTFATRAVTLLDPMKACEPSVGEEWKAADVGSGKYVTAIATCTTKTKDDNTVHGVELWGAEVGPDGKLKPAKASTRLTFAECKRWQPKRACPEGSVATGLRGYWDDPAMGLQGIALRCHALEARGK
ncbi:MAG TPA: hypothetical protein VH062_26680 [Polyangiaceae bacterium]|jgi:hypothetical protein|nr:hypothetical protein [Polyangiaceae bacterium]